MEIELKELKGIFPTTVSSFQKIKNNSSVIVQKRNYLLVTTNI